MKYFLTFSIGSIGYGLLEILWRGYTHPSMLFTGGICMVLILFISEYFTALSIFKKSFLCSFAITAVEMCVGVIVNLAMHLGVWDYSGLKYNLLGQISLLYTVLWFFLSLIILSCIDLFRRLRIRRKIT